VALELWPQDTRHATATVRGSHPAVGVPEPGSEPLATPQCVIRLALLEGFQLTVDGHTTEVVFSAQRLLAFLALQERPVLRMYVAASLWMDKSDERAAANLRAALWRLRRPGLTLVDATSNHLRISPEVSVDVREAVDRARRLLDPDADVPDSDYDAFILGGDVLPDWYDDWVSIERERLRQLRLHALEALCTRLTRAGRVAEAVDVGIAAVAAEPLRESANRVLMLAHLAEGNRAEAIRQYRAYRDLLWEELSVAPSPHLEDLIDELRVTNTVRVGDASATG
jgi:DNA-binding SARP family transcriptional activator